MQTDENRESASGLEFKLHPLVLINVSDHHTRTKANEQQPAGQPAGAVVKVIGILLGSQSGRTVDISNSFEVKYSRDGGSGAISLDMPFLLHKQEQYKQVFPKLDVVGWYATGEELLPEDMEVNRALAALNESPCFLLLNPRVDPARKELPVTLHETELHVVEGAPTPVFVRAHYTVETSDAERIGVDQVAKITASGRASGAEQLSAHLSGLHSALKMLLQRTRLVEGLVGRTRAGTEAPHPALLRKVHSLVSSLPAMDTPAFTQQLHTEHNDALLVLLLATMTKGVSSVGDTLDKVLAAYDHKSGSAGGVSRRRGAAGGLSMI